MDSRMMLIGDTIRGVFKTYRFRLMRFAVHLTPLLKSDYKLPSQNPILWIGDLMVYVFDLLLFPELHEVLLALGRSGYRKINDDEKIIARQYFKDSIQLDSVRINSNMSKRIEKNAHAFVSFNTINYHKRISKPIFVHELVHIWQYQRFGSVYIFRALLAQNSKEGYDYGGTESLYSGMLNKKEFLDFNFEQQGEIFEDYCRLREIQTEFQNSIVDASYRYYIDQVIG